MAKINIYKFIDDHGLDRKEVETLLFPTAKHPYYALNRVAKGEGLLDSEQLYKLAEMAGVSVSDLYDSKKWKMKSDANTVTFESEDYKAVLDQKTWITKIFKKDSMLHEAVICPGTTPLSEYLGELDKIVNAEELL